MRPFNAIVVVIIGLLIQCSNTANTAGKIDPDLLQKFESSPRANIFIEVMGSIDDVLKNFNATNTTDLRTELVKALKEFTDQAQKSVRTFLTSRYFLFS